MPLIPAQLPTIPAYNPTNYDPSSFNPWAIPANQTGGQYGFGTQQPGLGNTDPNAGITQLQMSGGYQGGYQVGQATNPYAAQLQWGQNQAAGYANQYTSQAPGMVNNINQSMQGLNNYAASSSYPSYPNAAGAGNQQAGGMSPMSTQQQPTTDTSNGAYGMNPWSLTGEAMTRK